MSDINNLYNNLTNFYNVNDENFKEFMAKLYDEMKANHKDVKYVKEHLTEEIESKLEKYLVDGKIVVKIGGTQISKLLNKIVTLASGTINGNSTKDFEVDIPEAAIGDTVIINPTSLLPDGVMWCAFAYQDHVKIRLTSVNNSKISINNFQFKITCIKYN